MFKRFVFILCSIVVIFSVLVFSCFAADTTVVYDYRNFDTTVRVQDSYANVDIFYPLNIGRYYLMFEDGSYMARNYQTGIQWQNSVPGYDTDLRFYPVGTRNMGVLSTDFLQNNSKCSVQVDLRIFNFENDYLTEFTGITFNVAYFDKNYMPISTQTVDMYDLDVLETETACTFYIALPPGAEYYHYYVSISSVPFNLGTCRFYCAYFNVTHEFAESWWSFVNIQLPNVDINGSGTVDDLNKVDDELFQATDEGRLDFLTLVAQSSAFLGSMQASFLFFANIFNVLAGNAFIAPLLVFSLSIGSFALLMGLAHTVFTRISRSFSRSGRASNRNNTSEGG